MKYCERIYSEAEIKLIKEIFDMYIKQIYDDNLEELVLQCKEMFLVHQKSLKEIERLNNIINELNTAYCKVITKCEEMIDSRFYMNDIAIKKYADEIKDICKYYVGEAKELKGSNNNDRNNNGKRL